MIGYRQFIRDYEKDGGVETVVAYTEAFRRYTEAILTWLKDLKMSVPRNDKQIDVEVLYAFPMIAQALKGSDTYRPHNQYQKQIRDKIVALREDRSPVPIISFHLTSIVFDWDRQLPSDIRYDGNFVDESKLQRFRLQKQKPYDLVYTFSLWTKYKSDMNYLWQQYLKEFDPVKYFFVDEQQIPLRLDSITDTSRLDSREGDEQLVRWDISTTMEGWLETDVVKVPTVTKDKLVMTEMTATGVGIDEWLKISRDFNVRTGEIKDVHVE